MRIETYIYFGNKQRKYNIGEVELTQEGIILKKKSKFLVLGFGAMGAAMAKSKPYQEIKWTEIKEMKLEKFRLMKNSVHITLNDDDKIVLSGLAKAKTSAPRIIEVFNQAKSIDTDEY